MTANPPIVLIHGMWLTPRSWEKWVDRYRGKGFEVTAPSWPGLEGEVEEIRRDPSPLRGLGIAKIAAHYEEIVRGLDRPPIVIGHSFGGLITQLLVDRGLAVAGIAIATAPVKGVIVLPPSTLRAAFPALRNPFGRNGLTALSPKQFHYRFTNLLSEEESRPLYERFYVPGTARAFFEDAFANVRRDSVAGVRFENDERAPLLFVAGDHDHISPISLNRTHLKLYSRSKALTELKTYDGRSHFMAGMDGWEEIADDVLDWAVEHTGVAPAGRESEATSRSHVPA